MKDMLGREFQIGDVIVHAAVGYNHLVSQRVGIVTRLNETTVSYSRAPETWRRTKEAIKTHLKVPHRTIIIGNVIFGEQPPMPESLLPVIETLQ